MSYRRQLRRALAAHRGRQQAEAIMAARWEQRRPAGATLRRLDDDGRPTGEVIHLDADQTVAMLEDVEDD